MLKLPFKSLYLSAVTPQGIVSRTEEVVNDSRFSKVVLLKGGTAQLRSDFLKAAADRAEQNGFKTKIALSATEDTAVEAVLLSDTAVVDGSSPFNIDPPFLGSKFYTLWLGDIYDHDKASQNRTLLTKLYAECKQHEEAAKRLLFAADCLLSDNKRIAFAAADGRKAQLLAAKIADEFIGGKGSEKFFITSGRYGKKGIESELLGYKVTAFKDACGGCAEQVLSFIYKQAKCRGCAFYAGFSPLYPYAFPEVLVFPDSGKAIFHADGCFKLSRKPDRVITSGRFTDKSMLSSRKRLLDANKKAAQKLLTRSEELFLQAAATRNEISRVAVGGEAADGRLLEQPRRRLFDLIF